MTPLQSRLYRFLLGRRLDDVQPSISEMAGHLDGSSRSSVHRMLLALQADDRVEKLAGAERCWRAIAHNPLAAIEDEDLVAELRRRGWAVLASRWNHSPAVGKSERMTL